MLAQYTNNVIGTGTDYGSAYFDINYVRAYTTSGSTPTSTATISSGSSATSGAHATTTSSAGSPPGSTTTSGAIVIGSSRWSDWMVLGGMVLGGMMVGML